MTDFHPLRSFKDDGSSTWQSFDREAVRIAKESPTAEMPTMDHSSTQDFQNVYEPSDDTFLLIDGIQYDIKKHLHPYGDGNEEENEDDDDTKNSPQQRQQQDQFKTILEIGCGSGIPIVFLAKLLPTARPIATDINPFALDFAQRTAKENGIGTLETIQCDLATPLLSEFRNKIDVIIFNPPYVPTPDEEVVLESTNTTTVGGIEASWAGGERGRRVIDRAIPQIAELLSPHGIGYMITVDDNEPEELSIIFKELGLFMRPFVRRRARNEYLSVQRITRMPPTGP